MRRVWLFNFDADNELAKPLGYQASAAVLARASELSAKVGGLLQPDDVLLGDGDTRGARGMAWCPTPRAFHLFAEAGVELPDAPSLDVLQRVNHRRFCAELGQTLHGARFLTMRSELDDTLSSATTDWLLKRPFSFSGRGRRRAICGRIDRDLERWVDASLRRDGLQVEPLVNRTADFALHGFVTTESWLLGSPCGQVVAEDGSWVATTPDAKLASHERHALIAGGELVGEALQAAGYFGPFGIDAYRYDDQFNPRSEINARYTMGWAVGMHERPDLVSR